MRASALYERGGQHITPETPPGRDAPAYDHARRLGATKGVPMTRRASNSATTAHIDHGHAGSQGGGNWAAQHQHMMAQQVARNQADYEQHTPEASKRRDLELNAAAERWMTRTQGAAALSKHHARVAREGLAYHPELLATMRQIGSEELKREQERAVARGAERAVGHKPMPPVPHHPQADTRTHVATKPLSHWYGKRGDDYPKKMGGLKDREAAR